MFDKFFDFVFNFIGLFCFWSVIREYEKGVLFRLGKSKKVLEPGLRLILPLNIDVVLKENIVPTTLDLPNQAITTSDDISFVISTVVTYKVHDIRKFLVDVDNADTVLNDSIRGTVRKILQTKTWTDLVQQDIEEEIKAVVRKDAFRWGIEVIKISFSDVVKNPIVHRIFTNNLSFVDAILE